MAIRMNIVGANPAIQSQWTSLPNSGFTTALSITEPPVKPPAHAKATGQLRLTGSFSGSALSDFIPATVLLLLAGFFIVTQ